MNKINNNTRQRASKCECNIWTELHTDGEARILQLVTMENTAFWGASTRGLVDYYRFGGTSANIYEIRLRHI
jgi:hypothetical protein